MLHVGCWGPFLLRAAIAAHVQSVAAAPAGGKRDRVCCRTEVSFQ